MTGEPESGLFVQTVGEFVGARLAFASVGAPAGGIVPAVTVTGGVHVDRDQEHVAFAELAAPGIDAGAPRAQAYIVFLGHDAFGIVTQVTEVGYYRFGYITRVGVFSESPVRGAFARRIAAVAVVNQDLHCVWVWFEWVNVHDVYNNDRENFFQ